MPDSKKKKVLRPVDLKLYTLEQELANYGLESQILF